MPASPCFYIEERIPCFFFILTIQEEKENVSTSVSAIEGLQRSRGCSQIQCSCRCRPQSCPPATWRSEGFGFGCASPSVAYCPVGGYRVNAPFTGSFVSSPQSFLHRFTPLLFDLWLNMPKKPFDIQVIPTHYLLKNASWACQASIGSSCTGEVFLEELVQSQLGGSSGPELCAVKRQVWDTSAFSREFAHQQITAWADVLRACAP